MQPWIFTLKNSKCQSPLKIMSTENGIRKCERGQEEILSCVESVGPTTQGEVKDSDGQVKHRSDLDELLGMSTTSMDFDVVSVEGEASVRVSGLGPNG